MVLHEHTYKPQEIIYQGNDDQEVGGFVAFQA
jgi:hypothetical protein